jgi:transcriptional regulator with XRE-family HTH domain
MRDAPLRLIDAPARLRMFNDPIDAAVGERIRLRRQRLGLSQTQLAEALGIAPRQVQKFERGANGLSTSMLVKTAAGLQTSVAALVGEVDSATVDPIVRVRLAIPGAVDLLCAFAAIHQDETRRALVTAAQALMRRS